MKLASRLLLLLLIMSCKPDYGTFQDYLPGYWEIIEVYKDGALIRTYNVSSQVEYFELGENGKGFRKKLMPSLDGSFKASDHISTFSLEVQERGLALTYLGSEEPRTEWITNASSEILVIENIQGFEYHYNKYEPLNLDDE